MKQLNNADFSNSLTTLYVSHFENECQQGKRMSARLRKVLTAYQHRVSTPGPSNLAEAKAAVTLSGSLLQDLSAVYPEILQENRSAAVKDNAVQALANLLNDIVMDLNRSIAMAEGSYSIAPSRTSDLH